MKMMGQKGSDEVNLVVGLILAVMGIALLVAGASTIQKGLSLILG